jgi:hypothetical protein
VTGEADHRVDPGDEGRHRPEDDELWNESYYLDFVVGEGTLAGYVRIGLYPNLGVTWWTTMVVGAGRPTVASVAYDLPPPRGGGLAVGHDRFTVAGEVVHPLTTMRVTATAPATVLPDPAAAYGGDSGAPTSLELDLTWSTDGQPYHYLLTTRYEIPCLVTGTVTVGDEQMTVSGSGQRDHSWGGRDWWAFGWCWAAARLDDGTRLHFADIRMPGQSIAFGYLQAPDGAVGSVETVAMEEELGHSFLPLSGHARIEPQGLAVEIRPIAFGPLLLVAPDGRATRFPRAAARFVTDDGRSGVGWIEWNQPELPAPLSGPAPSGR